MQWAETAEQWAAEGTTPLWQANRRPALQRWRNARRSNEAATSSERARLRSRSSGARGQPRAAMGHLGRTDQRKHEHVGVDDMGGACIGDVARASGEGHNGKGQQGRAHKPAPAKDRRRSLLNLQPGSLKKTYKTLVEHFMSHFPASLAEHWSIAKVSTSALGPSPQQGRSLRRRATRKARSQRSRTPFQWRPLSHGRWPSDSRTRTRDASWAAGPSCLRASPRTRMSAHSAGTPRHRRGWAPRR